MSEHKAIAARFNRQIARLLLGLLVFCGQAAAQEPPVLVILGDSLSAGYGLAPEQSFAQSLQRRLSALGIEVRVENAGVSGDTTHGGLARLEWSVGADADAVLVELGANDALRGLDPQQARANLDAILARLTQRKLPVLLAGMQAPPNMGAEYSAAFDGIFPELAKKYGVALYPFFLEGVAAKPELNQPDMMHPNAAGVEIITRRIAPHVAALLEEGQE